MLVSDQKNNCSQNVQDFFEINKFKVWAKKQAAFFTIPEEKFLAIFELIKKAALSPNLIQTLMLDVAVALGCDWEVGEKITVQILGDWFVPLASVVGDVSEEIKKCGGDPAKFSGGFSAPASLLNTNDYVDVALREWNVNEFKGVLRNRLVFILASFVKGERTAEETKAALLRPHKVGGMEMSEEVVARVMELIAERLRTNPFKVVTASADNTGSAVSNKKFNDIEPPATVVPVLKKEITTPPVLVVETAVVNSAKPVMSNQPTASLIQPPAKPSGKRMEDFFQKDDEAEIIKAAIVAKERAGQVDVPKSSQEAVEEIIRRSGLVIFDEDFEKKFIAAIDARWRGVREAAATRDLLERSLEQGGVAITGLQLSKVMEVLEEIIGQREKAAKEKIEIDRRLAKEKLLNTQPQPSVIVNQSIVGGSSEKKMPEPKLPILSSGSLLPSNAGRPRVDDITFVRKLSGPIEELRNLTLAEFRRLASDPQEAAMKLKDKVDLLEEQGFGKKLAAIKAWHSSVVNRLYVELTKEAMLNGRTVEEICHDHRGRNEEVFTPEEIRAIAKLNDDLRF